MDSLFAEPDLAFRTRGRSARGPQACAPTSCGGDSDRPRASVFRRKHPRRRSRPRLNLHSRGGPRGSVQSIVSEVPTWPFVRAMSCRRHFGYKPLPYQTFHSALDSVRPDPASGSNASSGSRARAVLTARRPRSAWCRCRTTCGPSPRPQEWSSDARSELRQQLASTSGRFTVDHLVLVSQIWRGVTEQKIRSASSRFLGNLSWSLRSQQDAKARKPTYGTYRLLPHSATEL